MVAELSALGWFFPIFAFLLVFIIIYAVLKKIDIVESGGVRLFISLIIASFFVVQTQLVDFVMLTSSWIAVIAVVLFFLFVVMAFIPGDKGFDFIKEKSWFGIVLLIIMVIIFLVASGLIFNWAVNWEFLRNLANKEWFGFLILIIIAAITAAVISKK